MEYFRVIEKTFYLCGVRFCLFSCFQAGGEDGLIGNQVQVLSDPVTVTEEFPFIIPLYRMYEKGKGSDDAEVRKPALYGEVKLPCKV